jgi:hypothetical protein
MSEIKKYEETTDSIVKSTLENLVQGLTGIATSTRSELILSISGILQKLLAGERLDSFLKEWVKLIAKGKIKDDYQYTEQHKMCLLELLNFLDKDIADEERFDAIKKIILISATEKYSNRTEVLPQQYIRIIKNLSSAELLIIIASYNASKDLDWKDNTTNKKSIGDWKKEILSRTGLVYEELLDIEVEKLINNRLLLPSAYGDGSGLMLGDHFRLTPVAFSLIDFMNYYESEV